MSGGILLLLWPCRCAETLCHRSLNKVIKTRSVKQLASTCAGVALRRLVHNRVCIRSRTRCERCFGRWAIRRIFLAERELDGPLGSGACFIVP